MTVHAAEKKQIKIEQFSLNRSVAYLGEEISADITVSAPAPLRKKTLRLRYYLDKKEIGRQTISDFDPSGNASTVFTFKDSPEGRFQFRVVLDIENEKINADEVSRQLAILSLPTGMTEDTSSAAVDEKTISGDPASGKPELSAEEINFDIPSPRVGEKIRIRTKISNSGAVQADNVKIRIFINGQPYGKDITMNIAAGAQVNVDSEFKATRQGKKDVLIFINPDGDIDEKSNRNNLLSKILIVRPAAKGKKPAVATAKAKQAGLANLVIYIETISGTHYTSDGIVHFYITNNSPSVSAKSFMMGVQPLQDSPGKHWLLRKQVKSLKPGETVKLAVKWPDDQLSSDKLFVASVDIEGKLGETDTRDNHTRPFRMLSTIPTQTSPESVSARTSQEPEIIITSPRKGGRLDDNGKLIVNWQSSGEIGSLVHIAINKSLTKETVFISTSNNDGAFVADLSSLPEGMYVLTLTSENRTVASQERTFQIERKKSVVIPELVSPAGGSSYRGEQQLKIVWPTNIKRTTGQQLDLILLEKSSKKILKLNNNPVAAKKGEFIWLVPDDGTVFGIYQLQARSVDGSLLAVTSEIELLPNFVSFEQLTAENNKQKIQTDLEIARTSFKGKNLEFLIMNNGPADISTSGLYGYKFTSYFVRKVPITSDEDLVVCTNTLLTELPQGEGQVISLGRDPDCPLGERDYGSKFIYVVNRFTLPTLDNQYLVDPKPLNNISKFYWPD
ncbi:MAG: CARDB domain-containing protein [Pseudomonadota bacterium]|nr:CARDB domain-containing protein [Pseudomonadota bacterium]